MFRNSKIPWEFLPAASVAFILKRFEITKGSLVIDDTDRKRSKKTKKISRVHKLKDKGSSGFVMGQCIVFLILATPKITIPVGFAFYMPDPELTEWNKRKKELKKAGIPEKQKLPFKTGNISESSETVRRLLEWGRLEWGRTKLTGPKI